jgi:hypothetical protein
MEAPTGTENPRIYADGSKRCFIFLDDAGNRIKLDHKLENETPF